jgi:hypothetical protein
LGQQYDQGDAHIDYASSTKRTVFGRFSRQDTETKTPPTFGFGAVPSVPINDPAAEDTVRQAIQDRGHDADLGINSSDFDGSQVKLSDFDVVVLLDNKSIIGRMPVAGRAAIRGYLLGGGRVVTGEGVIYDLGGDSALGPLWPASGCGAGPPITQITYTQVAPIDPIVDAGMPASFSLPLDNYCLTPVGGVRAFYQADTRQSGTLVPSLVGRVLPSGALISNGSS